MARCRETVQSGTPLRAVWLFQKLVERGGLSAINRDQSPDLVGQDKTEAALPYIRGGYVKCSRPEDHRFLQYKDQIYVGGYPLEFKAPMKIMPPDGLKYPMEFMKFRDRYPDYYPNWNRSIKEKAIKHGCACTHTGSWHLNTQTCLCPGDSLDEAGTKFEALKEDAMR